MFAFAFAGSLTGRDDTLASEVRVMVGAWCYAAPETTDVAEAPTAAAGVLKWSVSKRDLSAAVIWDQSSRQLFVGDVRLYNRAELDAALGVDGRVTSDLELAWLAYRRWGREAPSKLNGDFAFVAWNDEKRTLFAARDHLGVRPLFYCVESDRVFVASDVAQILPVAKKPLAIDGQTIAETLIGPIRSHARTHFKGIARLQGGYRMTASATGIHQERYWTPIPERRTSLSYGEHCERIRAAFVESVRARLESDKPIVAHSSGGFDSSSILMVADRIYGREPARPPLVTMSAVAPGMPCDDSAYMDAVAGEVRFEGVRWNVLDGGPSDLKEQFLSRPGVRKGIGGTEERDLVEAQRRGAGVLLSGVLGDTVLHASGVMRDMFRGGQWAAIWGFTVGNPRSPAPFRLMAKSVLGLCSPEWALRALQLLANRRSRRVPPWAGPKVQAAFPLRLPEIERLESPSHLAADLWSRLTSPGAGYLLDDTIAYGFRAGVEVRLPFANAQLIQAIFDVPWRLRMPMGDARRLGRDSLGGFLPKAFSVRRDQGSWMPVFQLQSAKLLPAIREVVFDTRWVSAPYVRQDTARALFDRVHQSASADPESVTTLTDIGVLEGWLRRVRTAIDCDIQTPTEVSHVG